MTRSLSGSVSLFLVIVVILITTVSAVQINESPDVVLRGGQINLTITGLPDGSLFSVDIGGKFAVTPGERFSFEVRPLSMPFALNTGQVSAVTWGTQSTAFAVKKGDDIVQAGDEADENGYFTLSKEYEITSGVYDYLTLSGRARTDTSIINSTMSLLGTKKGPDDSVISFTVEGIDNGEVALTVLVDGGQVLSKTVVVGEGIPVPTPTATPTPAPTTIPSTASPTVTTPVPTPTVTPPSDPDSGSDDRGFGQSHPVSAAAVQEVTGTTSVNVGGNSAITQVGVTGTGISGLIVTGTVVDSPGPENPPAPGTVYQYLDITPARYTRIDTAVITFSVPRSWLDEHHLSLGDVALYHLSGMVWNRLPTSYVKEENGRVHYHAVCPAFSRFAIAGETGPHPRVSIPAEVQNISSVMAATGTPAPADLPAAQEPVTTQTITVLAPESAPGLPITTLLAWCGAGVCLVVSGFLIGRWWIRKQNSALFREYD
ncbi:MAG: PGF-pre-PGF domain-containing protein [Methanoregula sp.]|nr:PGF-pre-PGF domain-containing protein [Methanoregula sp.]